MGFIFPAGDGSGTSDVTKAYVDGKLKEVAESVSKNLEDFRNYQESGAGYNHTINGRMEIAQRGKEFLTDGYTLDRWRVISAKDKNVKTSQTSENITGNNKNEMCIEQLADAPTTNPATWNEGIHTYAQQFHENYIVFNGKTVTISCHMKADSGTQYVFAFYNGVGGHHSPVFTFPGGVELISYTVPLNDFAIKGSVFTSAIYIIREGWKAGRKAYITNFELVISDKYIPSVPRPYAVELALCLRYYQRYGADSSYMRLGWAAGGSVNNVVHGIMNKISPMRLTDPTISWSGLYLQNMRTGAYIEIVSITFNLWGNTENVASLRITAASELIAGDIYSIQGMGIGGTYFSLDAELY